MDFRKHITRCSNCNEKFKMEFDAGINIIVGDDEAGCETA